MPKFLLPIIILLAGLPGTPFHVSAQDSPHAKTLDGFVRLLERPGGDWKESAKGILSEENFEELLNQMTEIRARIAEYSSAGIEMWSQTRGTCEYNVGGKTIRINFEMTETAPERVKSISLASDRNPSQTGMVTWESVEEFLDAAGEEGFEGAVLLSRNGEIILRKAYGLANREKQIKNRTDTIFAIGSAPIDFTRAAILVLQDDKKLSLDDLISKHFDNVPADKNTITIRHLMTGQSGLRDFHELPSDENPDHTWIDREEAVRRIFDQQLLFAPGAGQQHSHSAWVLLAAIVEKASGQSYQEFTKTRLFVPAGMMDTGFFGEPVAEERIAVGYGEQQSSEPNSPPNWGTTSWLVMGSGGQVSTLDDIFRWEVAMHESDILSDEAKEIYQQQNSGIAADGDMFGFEFMHSHDPESLFMVISNTIASRAQRRQFSALGKNLAELVQGEKAPGSTPAKFTLGIQMGVTDTGIVNIIDVVAGSAAEKGGLMVEDQLQSANGVLLNEDPLAVLAPLLEVGNPIEFTIQRKDQQLKLTVQPTARRN